MMKYSFFFILVLLAGVTKAQPVCEACPSCDPTVLEPQKSYQVFKKEDVIDQSKQLIESVRELLNLTSSAAAAALLRHFKWNKEKLISAYMSNPEQTLKDIGMASLKLETPAPENGSTLECMVCLEDDVKMKDTFALGCAHRYCNECWKEYLEVAVAGGPSCVYSQCMHPKCTELAHEECFKRCTSAACFQRYQMFLMRSFVDDNPHIHWCPAPGCIFSVRCDRRGREQPVTCECGLKFCFQCHDAEVGDHLPAKCTNVADWKLKNADESENVKWMIANCKRCPKCKSNIEKNGGCMHMTCRKAAGGCGYEFCWLCRGPWSEHGSETGGYYACNKPKDEGVVAADLKADNAKNELEEYMFYFHRYNSHRQAYAVAEKQKRDAETKAARFQTLFEVRSQDTIFLQEAALGLIEERRVLMWSYVYAYYLKRELGKESKEYSLFEFLQEGLERTCDKVSELYEQDEKQIADYAKFMEWKQELANRTRVAGRELEKFVEGVGDGLTSEKQMF